MGREQGRSPPPKEREGVAERGGAGEGDSLLTPQRVTRQHQQSEVWVRAVWGQFNS